MSSSKTINYRLLFMLGVVALIALLIRICAVMAIEILNPVGAFQQDSMDYWNIAENILRYGQVGYGDQLPLVPESRRGPVYPMFLAGLIGIGLNSFGVLIIQALLGASICAVLSYLTFLITNSNRMAFVVGAIMAVDIPSIVYGNVIYTETLFTLLLWLALLFLVIFLRRKNGLPFLLLSALVFGLLILCRSVVLFLPLVLAIIVASKIGSSIRERVFNVVVFLVVCYAVTTPWIVRNNNVFGVPMITANGMDLAICEYAAGAYARVENTTVAEACGKMMNEAERSFPGNTEMFPDRYYFSRHSTAYAAKYILSHPFEYIRSHIRGVMLLYLRPVRSIVDLQLGLTKSESSMTDLGTLKGFNYILHNLVQNTSSFTLILIIIQFPILIGSWLYCVVGLRHFFRFNSRITLLFVILLAYFSVFYGVHNPPVRFRVPFWPLVVITAVFGYENRKLGREKYELTQNIESLTNS